ncbi:MAG: hypothetical protein H0U48_07070 [Euzebyaceae bacterium]|nr:hypothetical protein [Euzebyaceae bacterium]
MGWTVHSRGGHGALLLVTFWVVAMAGACTPGARIGSVAPMAAPTEGSRIGGVVQARDALGEPVVALAEAVLRVADDLDTIRHSTPRGREMRRALDAVPPDVDDLRRAADAVRASADEAPDSETAALVLQAADAGEEAARVARAELRFLREVAEVDSELAAATATWDKAGSQSERRARLAEVAAQATSAGGETYDAMRQAFAREPLGEDVLEADSADRVCWRGTSTVAATAEALVEQVERLRIMLS